MIHDFIVSWHVFHDLIIVLELAFAFEIWTLCYFAFFPSGRNHCKPSIIFPERLIQTPINRAKYKKITFIKTPSFHKEKNKNRIRWEVLRLIKWERQGGQKMFGVNERMWVAASHTVKVKMLCSFLLRTSTLGYRFNIPFSKLNKTFGFSSALTISFPLIRSLLLKCLCSAGLV